MTKGFRKNSEAALVEGKGRTCKRKKNVYHRQRDWREGTNRRSAETEK